MIKVKRVYDPAEPEDGLRFLVDRLWPRGVKRAVLRLDDWLKAVAPSDDLRRWFGHDSARWDEFRRRYFAELDSRREAWQPLLAASRRDDITLLYGASDRQHNNALALKDYLEQQLRAGHSADVG
jgi:uncharacterized protein YeaO (DUF488 family)